MSKTQPVPLAGQTYQLAEDDYRFGEGPLMARVTRVVRPILFDNEPWWEVNACVAWGTPVHHGDMFPERLLYIREAALQAGPLP